MKLLRVEFENFRVFKGRQMIEFSTDPSRPVTLVHALNGSGKTTMLNAIIWTFYGRTTPQFANVDTVATYGAERAIVRVRFEHRNSEYEAERVSTSPGSNGLKVFSLLEGGIRKEISAPESFLNSVLPRDMAGYFFVDGENAQRFGLAAKRAEIAKAIRDMLGFNLAKQALEDLKAVSDEFRRSIARLPGAEQAAKISDEIDRIEADMHRKILEYEKKKKAIEQRTNALADLAKLLRDHATSKQLQQLRDELRRQVDNSRRELERAQSERREMFARTAPTLFAETLSQTVIDVTESLRKKGRVPAPYNRVFVRDLIEAGTCVCGRPLHEGEEAWGHVNALLGGADDGFVQDRITRAQSQATHFARGAGDAAAGFSKVEERIGRIETNLRSLEGKLADADRKMADVNVAEIADTEARRKRLEAEQARDQRELGALQTTVGNCRAELARLRRSLEEVLAQHDKLSHLQVPKEIADQAAEYLRDQLEIYERDAVEEVRELVAKELEQVVQKDFRFEMSDDYQVRWVHSPAGGAKEAAPSTGEGILLGLIFIAGLCKFSATRVEDESQLLTPGTVAPMVLDAPMGQLDLGYRKAVASLVPKLAGQVVFLLTDSQSEGVLDILRPMVGKEYVAQSHSRSLPQKGGPSTITVNIQGRDYALRSMGSRDEYTELVEVK